MCNSMNWETEELVETRKRAADGKSDSTLFLLNI